MSTLVGFVAVKFPATELRGGLQATRLELSPLLASARTARQLLQIVSHRLIQAFTHFLSRLAGALSDLFVDREGDVHAGFHLTIVELIMCALVMHVKLVVTSKSF